jgi:hydroxyacid-oxoacid transhydrogenase
LGVNVEGVSVDFAGDVLADALIQIMKDTGMPNGLGAIGFSEADVDKLVEGTLPQQRLTKLSPRPVTATDLGAMFQDAMRYW